MRRLSIVLVVFGALISSVRGADKAKFGEPLKVATEAAKIQARFAKARAQAGGDAKAAQRALAERSAGLLQLVAAAEAAKSDEHRELASLDFLLARYGAAAREARKAIKSDPSDYAAHALLIQSLCRTKQLEEARAALRQALGSPVKEDSTTAFLTHLPAAAMTVSSLLASRHDFAAADATIDDWESKLEKLKPKKEAAQQLLDRATTTVKLMRSRVEITRKQEALVGQPYFPITDATWLNGPAIKPEELRGKVVLLDFWAVWCGPCIATFPHLREWHDKYGDQGLVIIGATSRYGYGWDAEKHHIERPEKPLDPAEEDAATTQFLKYHDVKHRIAVLKDRDLSQKYLVQGIPQAVLIDKQGIIRMIRVGSSQENAEELEAGIRQALGLKAETASK